MAQELQTNHACDHSCKFTKIEGSYRGNVCEIEIDIYGGRRVGSLWHQCCASESVPLNKLVLLTGLGCLLALMLSSFIIVALATIARI